VLPVHPAAELFPLMSEAELRELGEDIKTNGLKSPIVLWSPGTKSRKQSEPVYLLDGRNRLDAMELAGLETVDDERLSIDADLDGVADAAGDRHTKQIYGHVDPYTYALSANIHRRHLTAEQKRDLIAKVLKARPEQSNRQIAKQVRVGNLRKGMESTGDVPQLEKTVGKDGKERPAKRSSADRAEARCAAQWKAFTAQEVFDSPQEAHDKATAIALNNKVLAAESELVEALRSRAKRLGLRLVVKRAGGYELFHGYQVDGKFADLDGLSKSLTEREQRKTAPIERGPPTITIDEAAEHIFSQIIELVREMEVSESLDAYMVLRAVWKKLGEHDAIEQHLGIEA
jgi:hypothetical protein